MKTTENLNLSDETVIINTPNLQVDKGPIRLYNLRCNTTQIMVSLKEVILWRLL